MKRSMKILMLVFFLVSALILSSVSVFADSYIFLECEECDDYTDEENIYGNEQNRFIKIESINVGGTFPGAWIMFSGVDFYGNGADKIAVNYAKKPDSCAPDTALEFRLDSLDGEVIAEVPLTIAEGWGNYNLATADLTRTVTGKHDVYMLMKGTHTPQYVYIGQLDYVEFFESDEAPETGDNGDETASPSTTPEPTASQEPTDEKTEEPSQPASTEPSETPTDVNTIGDSEESSLLVWIIVIIAVIVVFGGIAVFIFFNKKNKAA